MSRTDLPVLAGMGAVAFCTSPAWRACGVLGRQWLRRRACLVLWPSYLANRTGPPSRSALALSNSLTNERYLKKPPMKGLSYTKPL